ncbi:MAG: hypothetical protein R3185_04630 [Candidatus Thermoplasmatota archaeon]|nr:hypothetical protein [Candidatus Thermoplasmatota archaeon]
MALPLIPLLTSLLPLAGAAAPLIGKALGASEDTQKVIGDVAKAVTGKGDVETAVEAIKQDPNLALKFEMAVLQKETDIQRMIFEDMRHEREMHYGDLEDARGRDVEVRKLTGGTNTRPNVMLVCAAATLIFVIWQINTADLSSGVLAIYNMIIGALLKMLGDAFAFEFGSSRGSKEKSSQLEKLLQKIRDR